MSEKKKDPIRPGFSAIPKGWTPKKKAERVPR